MDKMLLKEIKGELKRIADALEKSNEIMEKANEIQSKYMEEIMDTQGKVANKAFGIKPEAQVEMDPDAVETRISELAEDLDLDDEDLAKINMEAELELSQAGIVCTQCGSVYPANLDECPDCGSGE